MIFRIVIAIMMMVFCLGSAEAQVVPSGSFTPGHTIRCANSQCTVITDGGSANGSSVNGAGYLTELGITNTGTPLCISDALTNASGGYHQLCLGANSLGGGLLSYNSYGGASSLPFQFVIDGTVYPFPGPGSGNVLGPVSTTIGDLAVWNNTAGSLLKDVGSGGTIPSSLTIPTPAVTGSATFTNTGASGPYSVTGSISTNPWTGSNPNPDAPVPWGYPSWWTPFASNASWEENGTLNVNVPQLYGSLNTASAASVIGNSNNPALVQNTYGNSIASFEGFGDVVGFYNEISAINPVLTSIGVSSFTSTTAVLSSSLTTNQQALLKVGMYICVPDCTYQSVVPFVGQLKSWTASVLTVDSWWRGIDQTVGQIPSGATLEVSPTLKIFGMNTNVFLNSNAESNLATGYEIDVRNNKGSVATNPWPWYGGSGIDINGSGSDASGTAYLARGNVQNGFVSTGAQNASFAVYPQTVPQFTFTATGYTSTSVTISPALTPAQMALIANNEFVLSSDGHLGSVTGFNPAGTSITVASWSGGTPSGGTATYEFALGVDPAYGFVYYGSGSSGKPFALLSGDPLTPGNILWGVNTLGFMGVATPPNTNNSLTTGGNISLPATGMICFVGSTACSTGNMALYNDATNTLVNVASGGAGALRVNNTSILTWTATGITAVQPITYNSLPSGTPATYACFTAGGELISSGSAC